MLIYATSADLAAWTGQAEPVNAGSLLRAASLLVTEATACDWYTVDDDGFPSAANVAEAMRDATCAQAEVWSVSGIDPIVGNAATPTLVSEKQIGSARIRFATYDSMITARELAAKSLCDAAVRILRQAQLASSAPLVV